MKKTIQYLVVLLLAFFWASFPGKVFAASEQRYEVISSYDVNENGTVSVSSTYTVTNLTDRALANLSIVIPSRKPQSLSVVYGDGQTVSFEQKAGQGNTTDLNLTFHNLVSGKDNSWQFLISYVASDLVKNIAGVKHLYIPQHKLEGASYAASLRIPESFATEHFLPKPQSSGMQNEKLIYNYNNEQLKKGLSAIFGDETTYELSYNKTLSNKSLWPKTKEILLPTEVAGQKVFIKEVSPQPNNYRLDEDGNIYAVYKVGVFGKKNIRMKALITTRLLNYDLSKYSEKDLHEGLGKYLKDTKYWDKSDAVTVKAKELSGGNLPETTHKILDFIANYTLNPGVDYSKRQPASKLLENKELSALEANDLLIAMLRSQNIPARQISGSAAVMTADNPMQDINYIWSEAYLNGVGWVILDPLWYQKYGGFGSSYIDHVAMTISDQQVAGLNDFKLIKSLEEPPKDSAAGADLRATNYLVFPGISLISYQVKSNSNQIIDGLTIKSQPAVAVGSLAPHESKNLYYVRFGAASFQKPQLDLKTGEKVLSTATASYNFLPFLGLLVLAGNLTYLVIKKPKAKPPQSTNNPQKPEEDDHKDEDRVPLTDSIIDSLEKPDTDPESAVQTPEKQASPKPPQENETQQNVEYSTKTSPGAKKEDEEFEQWAANHLEQRNAPRKAAYPEIKQTGIHLANDHRPETNGVKSRHPDSIKATFRQEYRDKLE